MSDPLHEQQPRGGKDGGDKRTGKHPNRNNRNWRNMSKNGNDGLNNGPNLQNRNGRGRSRRGPQKVHPNSKGPIPSPPEGQENKDSNQNNNRKPPMQRTNSTSDEGGQNFQSQPGTSYPLEQPRSQEQSWSPIRRNSSSHNESPPLQNRQDGPQEVQNQNRPDSRHDQANGSPRKNKRSRNRHGTRQNNQSSPRGVQNPQKPKSLESNDVRNDPKYSPPQGAANDRGSRNRPQTSTREQDDFHESRDDYRYSQNHYYQRSPTPPRGRQGQRERRSWSPDRRSRSPRRDSQDHQDWNRGPPRDSRPSSRDQQDQPFQDSSSSRGAQNRGGRNWSPERRSRTPSPRGGQNWEFNSDSREQGNYDYEDYRDRDWNRGPRNSRQSSRDYQRPRTPPQHPQEHRFREHSPEHYRQGSRSGPHQEPRGSQNRHESQGQQDRRFRDSSPPQGVQNRGGQNWSPERYPRVRDSNGTRSPSRNQQGYQDQNRGSRDSRPTSREGRDYQRSSWTRSSDNWESNSNSRSRRDQGNYDSNYEDYPNQGRRRSTSPYDQGGQNFRQGSRSPPREQQSSGNSYGARGHSPSSYRQESRSPSREQNSPKMRPQTQFRDTRSPPRDQQQYHQPRNGSSNSWESTSRSPAPQGPSDWNDDGYRNRPQSPRRDHQDQRFRDSSPYRTNSWETNSRSPSPRRRQRSPDWDDRGNDDGYRNRPQTPPRDQHRPQYDPRGVQNYQERSWTPARHSPTPLPQNQQDQRFRDSSPRGEHFRQGSRFSSRERLRSESHHEPRGSQNRQESQGHRDWNRGHKDSRPSSRDYQRSSSTPREPQEHRFRESSSEHFYQGSRSGPYQEPRGSENRHESQGLQAEQFRDSSPPRGIQNQRGRNWSPERRSRTSSPRGGQNWESNSRSRDQGYYDSNRQRSNSPHYRNHRGQDSRSSSRAPSQYHQPRNGSSNSWESDSRRSSPPRRQESSSLRRDFSTDFRRLQEGSSSARPMSSDSRRPSEFGSRRQEAPYEDEVFSPSEEEERPKKYHFPNAKKSWLAWLEEQDAREDSGDDMGETIGELRRVLEEEVQRPARPTVRAPRRATGGWIPPRVVRVVVERTIVREKTMAEWKAEAAMKCTKPWYPALRPTIADPTSHYQRYQDPPCTLYSKLTRVIAAKEYSNPGLRTPCVYCAKRHKHDECPFIVDVKERREHLLENGHCLRCLWKHRVYTKCSRLDAYKCEYCDDMNSDGELHHHSICPNAA